MTGSTGFTRTTLTRQLTDQVRQDIADGVYRPGSMLPSETAMSNTYQVSRNVVRAAIATLTHEGLISPVHGKGTYVRGCAHPELVITRAPGDPWTHLAPEDEPTRHVDHASPFWAQRFGLPPDALIYRSEQTLTHTATGRRFHTIRTLPSLRLEEIGNGIEPDPSPFQARADLIHLLTRHYGPLQETDLSQPTMPSPDYVALLAIPPGTALSVVTRLTSTQGGTVVMAETERANSEGLEYRWTP